MLPDPIFLNVHMYGVMIAVGLMLAFLVLFYYGKHQHVDAGFLDFLFYNGVGSIAVGFGSAALFQAIYNYIEDPSKGFRFNGGITFLGGLIGGATCFLLVYVISKRWRKSGSLAEIFALVPCCITIAHAFGRVGCFFAGCCHGVAWNGFCAVKFPHLSYTVHPTQLYEATFLLLLFGVMSWLFLKKKFYHNMSVYLISYGIWRFCLEFIRGDHRGELVSGISPSQFWSLLMVVLGVALIFVMNYLAKRPMPIAEESTPADEPAIAEAEQAEEATEE
ncbi:MAG: prolipoprotein diacylglyceryl transferase [Clostridia bacterium]|nr:prolipoprotein diacylglyceryl transferase [Clostridia bacterium]